MTMFYNFFATQANAILEAYYQGKYQKTGENVQSGGFEAWRWAPLAKTIMYRVVLVSLIGTVMRMALLREGDDDKDKYEKDESGNKVEIPLLQRFMKQFAKNTLSTASGMAYGIRDIASFFINLTFEGTDYGRGITIGGASGRAFNEVSSLIKLINSKGASEERREEAEKKRAERLKKMNPRARKKALEAEQYKKKPKIITNIDIAKTSGEIGASLLAGRTGITAPIVDAVMTSLQYLFDDDGQYEATLNNIIWSAAWSKKPVRKEVPEKPPEKKKKGRR